MTDDATLNWHSSADGLSLFYRRYEAPARDGAVICLHGLGETSAAFEPLARSLARGRAVLLPDLRGYGRSDYALDLASYALDMLVADFGRLLHTERLRRFALVGHGFGGLLALKFAREWPERVPAIAMIETALAPAPEASMSAAADWDVEATPRLRASIMAAAPTQWIEDLSGKPMLVLMSDAMRPQMDVHLARLQRRQRGLTIHAIEATPASMLSAPATAEVLGAFLRDQL